MKKILILLIIMIFLLTGCNKIKNEKDVLNYVKKNFGDGWIVSKEKINDEKEVYNINDTKNKFNYSCTSFIDEVNIDGSTFSKYPKIECNFEEKYKDYIYMTVSKKYSDINIENPQNFSDYYDGSNNYENFIIYIDSVDNKNIVSLLKNIKEVDERGYFKNFSIEIYDNNNEKIGVITSKDYKILTTLEENEKWFIDYAKKMFSSNGETTSNEITYLRKEVNVLIKDNDELYNGLLRKNYFGLEKKLETATTTIYYFYDNIEKIEFYIIDYQLDGMGCYFNNYPIEVRNSSNISIIKNCKL